MTEPGPGVATIRAARSAVLDRIAAACARVGRDPRDGHARGRVQDRRAGPAARRRRGRPDVLGENRVQEGVAKAPEVPGATWDLVGPLQSNKARRALEIFERIQSVDSVDLARAAGPARAGGAGPAAATRSSLQVNVDVDPAKAGFVPADCRTRRSRRSPRSRASRSGAHDRRSVRGRPRPRRAATFVALRALSERVRTRLADRLGPELSMGMTDDFEVAVEEGATIVRVGRALFGERPHHHARRARTDHAH